MEKVGRVRQRAQDGGKCSGEGEIRGEDSEAREEILEVEKEEQ